MPRKTWRAALAAYASPSILVLLLLGFAAGLPYMLVFSTLSVWLREAGVARETIGYASLIGLAYAFKWVWSPLLDQWRLPLLGGLGRRRSWLLLSQALVVVGLVGMSLCDPQQHLSWLIAMAVLVAFASATQDIAVDAYRLEIADDQRQAALAASYMAGYRVAALLATAGALFFAEWFGSTGFSYLHKAWAGTYVMFGVMMLPALFTTLVMREPPVPMRTQLSAARYGLVHQLASVFVLIILLVSVPASFTQMFNTGWSSVISGDATPLDLLLEDRAFLRLILYVLLSLGMPVQPGPPRPRPGADPGQRLHHALPLAGLAAAWPDCYVSHVGHGDGRDGQRVLHRHGLHQRPDRQCQQDLRPYHDPGWRRCRRPADRALRHHADPVHRRCSLGRHQHPVPDAGRHGAEPGNAGGDHLARQLRNRAWPPRPSWPTCRA